MSSSSFTSAATSATNTNTTQAETNPSASKIRKQVYVRGDQETVWLPAEIVSKNANQTVTVRTSTSTEPFTVNLREYRGLELPKYCPRLEEDLTDLKYVHEASILHNLCERNSTGFPYTRCSTTTIVAVNPFQWHPTLYNEATRRRYSQELVWKKYDEQRDRKLEPHLYEISSRAYAELMMEQRNQSILVTGESGSGKTESAKLLLHHIADISGTSKSKLVQRILDSNPCLEAFGNAVTVRNDNSSRFGKYVQLQFDQSGAVSILTGSRTLQFLLETSRVCQHSESERSFHIFYQILASDDKESYWDELRGKTIEDFKYLGSSAIHEIEEKSDMARFQETVKALQTCQIPVETLLQAVCMTMQLGNIIFTPGKEDHAILSSHDELQKLSKLMGIAVEELRAALTVRTMKPLRGESLKVRLSVAQSREVCDALAKEIYSKSFRCLVEGINKATIANKYAGTIGLLDIFGFESLETNSFGQLCINYANEKLQQKTSHDIFLKTAVEYEREGIPLDNIEFEDNERVLAVLEGRINGVMALLNEECYRPGGNDYTFVQKVLSHYKNSKYVTGPSHKRFSTQFGVVHYAGKVFYDADNFVIQNKDCLPMDLKDCMKKSSNWIVAECINDRVTDVYANNACASLKNIEMIVEDNCNSVGNVGSKSTTRSGKLLFEKGQRQPAQNSSAVVETSADNTRLSISQTSVMQNKPILRSVMSFNRDKIVSADHFRSLPQMHDSDFAEENRALHKYTAIKKQDKPKLHAAFSFSEYHDMQRKDFNRSNSTPLISSCATTIAKSLTSMKSANSDLMSATVWSKYQNQLTTLLQMLNQTQSRYVRCIKPNSKNQPRVNDLRRTIEQLRCSGLVAITLLSRATYSTSLQNKVIRYRYKSMWNKERFPSQEKRMDTGDRKLKLECEALLASALEPLEVSSNDGGKRNVLFVVGKTRTYFKKGILDYLEKNYLTELDDVAAVIQKHTRGILARNRLRKIYQAVPTIQQWYRRAYNEKIAYINSLGGSRRRYLEARKVFSRNRTFHLQLTPRVHVQ